MFLRVHAGTAEYGKLKYEMAYLMGGSPIVESKQTGKWFTLSWQDILDLARKAGIDDANAPREARRGSDVALHGDVGRGTETRP